MLVSLFEKKMVNGARVAYGMKQLPSHGYLLFCACELRFVRLLDLQSG